MQTRLLTGLLLLALLALPSAAFAMAMALSLEQALKEGDFIGRVRILDCQPLKGQGSAQVRDKDDPDVDRYQQLARAEVLDAARGAQKGDIVLIEFDNGLGCPNIFFSPDDDRLVFARKLKNGHLVTLNTYAGSWEVKEGKVDGFDLLNSQNPALARSPSVKDILAEFRRLTSSRHLSVTKM